MWGTRIFVPGGATRDVPVPRHAGKFLPGRPARGGHRACDVGRSEPDHGGAEELPYDASAEKSARKGKNDRRPILTLEDYVFSIYDQLLKAGWRMRDIDEMDMLGFLEVRAWSAGAGWTGTPDGKVYIDDVL